MSMTVHASGVRLLPSADLPQAAVDLVDGRTLGRLGALLPRTTREVEDHVLDLLA